MELKGKNVLIMGLGLNGGGLAAAQFSCEQGANVKVTDLRSAAELEPSLKKLNDYQISYVLGKHCRSDFENADIVVKNPAVPLNSDYLQLAQRIETDLSLFLQQRPQQPIFAITGTKGKTTISTLLHKLLLAQDQKTQLAGNCGVSPLQLLKIMPENAPLVLELSSWQLGDLAQRGVLKPYLAIISNLMPDHLNRYANFTAYAQDKLSIFNNNSLDTWVLLPQTMLESGRKELWLNDYSTWKKRIKGKIVFIGDAELVANEGLEHCAYLDEKKRGWLQEEQQTKMLFDKTALEGEIGALNSLFSAVAAHCAGLTLAQIKKGVETFVAVEHRLQPIISHAGVDYYNDSAATIPEATVAALKSFPHRRIQLLCGGTDKKLDFSNFVEALKKSKVHLHLLAGSATQNKLLPLLKKAGFSWQGPYKDLLQALERMSLKTGDLVLFSPGATSFEHFLNEFDRGKQFCKAVKIYTDSLDKKRRT